MGNVKPNIVSTHLQSTPTTNGIRHNGFNGLSKLKLLQPRTSNTLFSAKPILPSTPAAIKSVEIEAVHRAKPTTLSTNVPIRKHVKLSNEKLDESIVCKKPSIIGSRLARSAKYCSTVQYNNGTSEPTCFATWNLLQSKLPGRVFKFDTPSPDKLVGVGVLALNVIT